MKAISLPSLTVEATAYIALQSQMHDALIAQHPEWIESDGNCPQCHDYDRRFAELLTSSISNMRTSTSRL